MAVGGRGVVYPHLEIWHYGDFSITFRNGGNGFDGWKFSPQNVVFGGSAIGAPASSSLSSQYVFNRTPPRYVDPYRKYSLPHQIAAFQAGDSIEVVLSYALPKNRLRMPNNKASLESGVFLFDEDWHQVYAQRQRNTMEWPAFRSTAHAKADSLRHNHLISHHAFAVKPASRHVVVEVKDRLTGHVGTFREQRVFVLADTGLAMSDLLLASWIEAKNPMPTGRRDFEIVPNPIRTYHASEPVFIYLEVYHLAQDGFGQTRYDISYRLGPADKKEVDPALFVATDISGVPGRVVVEQVLGEGSEARADYQVRYVFPEDQRSGKTSELFERAGRGVATEVTVEYGGDQPRDFTYLQIDVQQVPPGVYKLRVEVRDRHSQQRVERTVLFRIVG